MPMIVIQGEEVDFRPFTREMAAIWQQVCTALGVHTYCPFRACRRHKRCATRQVMCHQIARQEINAVALPMLQARMANSADRDRSGIGDETGVRGKDAPL